MKKPKMHPIYYNKRSDWKNFNGIVQKGIVSFLSFIHTEINYKKIVKLFEH